MESQKVRTEHGDGQVVLDDYQMNKTMLVVVKNGVETCGESPSHWQVAMSMDCVAPRAIISAASTVPYSSPHALRQHNQAHI